MDKREENIDFMDTKVKEIMETGFQDTRKEKRKEYGSTYNKRHFKQFEEGDDFFLDYDRSHNRKKNKTQLQK